MKLRLLFEGSFCLSFFHLNYGFCLRAASIQENTVFSNNNTIAYPTFSEGKPHVVLTFGCLFYSNLVRVD